MRFSTDPNGPKRAVRALERLRVYLIFRGVPLENLSISIGGSSSRRGIPIFFSRAGGRVLPKTSAAQKRARDRRVIRKKRNLKTAPRETQGEEAGEET